MFHHINIYYFINEFNREEILKLDKKVNIIYRNYEEKVNFKTILDIKKTCKISKRKFFIANDYNTAIKFDLDGIYIPAFNKNLKIKYKNFKKIELIGSAHNFKEIFYKEKQGVKQIFLSPIFPIKKNKFFLDIVKFNLISKITKKKLIALGGINQNNIKKLKIVNCCGFASKSYLKDSIKNE